MLEKTTPNDIEPKNLHEIDALKHVQVRDGVELRLLEPEDATELLKILEEDPSIRDRVSVASKMHSPEDVKDQVELYKYDAHLIRYTVFVDDKPAGLVNFWRDVDGPFNAPDNPDDYGFGYFIAPEQRGKGIVSDSVRTLMQIATEHLPLNQFIAYCEDDNVESVAVLSKLGFTPTDITLVEPNSGWEERKFICPAG